MIFRFYRQANTNKTGRMWLEGFVVGITILVLLYLVLFGVSLVHDFFSYKGWCWEPYLGDAVDCDFQTYFSLQYALDFIIPDYYSKTGIYGIGDRREENFAFFLFFSILLLPPFVGFLADMKYKDKKNNSLTKSQINKYEKERLFDYTKKE
jgi:hypothetical protein